MVGWVEGGVWGVRKFGWGVVGGERRGVWGVGSGEVVSGG